jgi:hypothetical protein
MFQLARAPGKRYRWRMARYYGLLVAAGFVCGCWMFFLGSRFAPPETVLDADNVKVFRPADAGWYPVLLCASALSVAGVGGYLVWRGWWLLRRGTGFDNLLGWFALLWCLLALIVFEFLHSIAWAEYHREVEVGSARVVWRSFGRVTEELSLADIRELHEELLFVEGRFERQWVAIMASGQRRPLPRLSEGASQELRQRTVQLGIPIR